MLSSVELKSTGEYREVKMKLYFAHDCTICEKYMEFLLNDHSFNFTYGITSSIARDVYKK